MRIVHNGHFAFANDCLKSKAKLFVGSGKCQFLVRLFEYIPGELLRGKTCTVQLCYSVGQTASRIDKALEVSLQTFPR